MKSARLAAFLTCSFTRYRLLNDALSGVKDIASVLSNGCKTQAAFAALDIPSKGVERVALNTLKASADSSIEIGGWMRLDAMRRQYYRTSKSPRKSIGAAPPTGISDAAALALERRVRIRLEVAYVDLLLQITKLARTDHEMDDFLGRHRAGFSIERVRAVAGGRKNE